MDDRDIDIDVDNDSITAKVYYLVLLFIYSILYMKRQNMTKLGLSVDFNVLLTKSVKCILPFCCVETVCFIV